MTLSFMFTQAVVTTNLDRIKARNSAERWTQEEIDAAFAELETRLIGSAFATCVFREIHNECSSLASLTNPSIACLAYTDGRRVQQ